MKLTNLETLLLYGWGCADYEETLYKLQELRERTETEDMLKVIDSLRSKLIVGYTWTTYPLLYAKVTYKSWLEYPELSVSAYRKSGDLQDTSFR